MSDENKKYVPEGVFLVCDKGSIPTQLICDPQEINIYGVRYADENDNKPLLNIPSFAVCKTLGTCVPPPGLTWTKLKTDVTLHGFHPLLEDSECLCPTGAGIIKIFFDKYAAELAAENNSESDFVKEPISSMALGLLGSGLLGMIFPDYRDGVGRGLKKGAEGTWNLLKDIWNKPGETLGGMARGLGNMAVIGGVYLGNASNPLGTLQADAQLRSLDARFGTNFVGTRDAIATGVGGAVENAVENVRRGNWGEVGEDVGQVQYAVIEAVVGSKGAGLALKGLKTGAQVGANVAKGLIGAQRLAQIAAKSTQVLNRIKFATSGIVRIGRRNLAKYPGFGGDIALDANKTTTIIGKFTDTVDGAGTSKILEMPDGSFARGTPNKGGLNILDLPDAEYKKLLSDYGEDMGKEIFWQRHNQPFLEDAFKRGDNVRLLSNPDNPANRTGFYARELTEVEGYVDKAGNRVPGLAEKYGYKYNPVTKTYEKR
jgi:hypothetical protein